MDDFIDPLFFKDLAAAEPEDVCRRALCRYNALKRCYFLSVWGNVYAVYPEEARIQRRDGGEDSPGEYLGLFMVHYLLKSKAVDIHHQWISEKDIPGGPTFFRGPHQIPTDVITGRFGNHVNAFHDRCRTLGGTPLALAEAAYRFVITERIPVGVLYWCGDDLFPPEAKVLFDETIVDHLALDVVFALAVSVCRQLGMTTGEKLDLL